MEKSLDRKLSAIQTGQYTPESFVIADAKDGDMAFGTQCPGPDKKGVIKTKKDYLDAMDAMTNSGLVDIMLMSASSAETLHKKDLFSKSAVTPAVRLNDTTDIWSARGSRYRESPSIPFATADIPSVLPYANLGLYSMTFYNDVDADVASLNAYREFRHATREHNFDHFLEVFNPAYDVGIANDEIGFYINDMIIKAVAGVTSLDAPKFLKIQFNGHAAMSELCNYDPENLIVGILGGSAGTVRDTFELAHQAEKAGARVALFGRKINLSESPVELVRLMRETITGKLSPLEAANAYHDHLENNSIPALRSRENDVQISDPVLMS